MFAVAFKILSTLGPFIREIFLHKKEERRVWFFRTLLMISIALVAGWLFYTHHHGNYERLSRENEDLRESNRKYQMEFQRIAADRNHHLRLYEDRLDSYNKLYDQYSRAQTGLEGCRQEVSSLHIQLLEARHTLTTPPSSRNEPEGKRKDRLEELN